MGVDNKINSLYFKQAKQCGVSRKLSSLTTQSFKMHRGHFFPNLFFNTFKIFKIKMVHSIVTEVRSFQALERPELVNPF